MDRTVRYHPLFHSDVIEAAAWYDERNENLGNAFADNAYTTTNKVMANPQRFPKTSTGLRCAQIQRFPYIVIFDFTEKELILLGVLHTARSIEKWRLHRQ